jgi:gas vesicle protein
MSRSVEELRRESERSRAELATTVGDLKERLSDTAEDIRHKVSPQHIKSEVSDYFTQKAQGWVGALKQQAMDNPMQAIAAGTAVAVPMLRLVRGFPLPLLMIGAGLALTSKTARDRAAAAAAPALDRGKELLDTAADRADAFRSKSKDAISSVQSQATGLAADAQEAVTGVADDLRDRAAEATSSVTDKFWSGVEAAKDTVERARSAAKDAAASAPPKARQAIGENAALVAGLGIAIGGIIAAALPKTSAEAKVTGPASDSLRRAAGEAVQSGFDAASDRTRSAASAAASAVTEADLGGHATRLTKNMADTLKEAADDAVAAAFNPSRPPNT